MEGNFKVFVDIVFYGKLFYKFFVNKKYYLNNIVMIMFKDYRDK